VSVNIDALNHCINSISLYLKPELSADTAATLMDMMQIAFEAKQKETASDCEESKAADGKYTIRHTAKEYTNAPDLSSYEAGTRVITVDGYHGEIKKEIDDGVLVELDIGRFVRYEMWDLREEIKNDKRI